MRTTNKKYASAFPGRFRVLLVWIFLLMVIQPAPADARGSEQLEICGEGVETEISFDMADLEQMEQYQHVYSTINTWPTKKWCVGRGVKLRDLLHRAGIKESATLINFTSSDGYTVTLTVKEMLKDKRYYYPHLKDNSPSDGSIPGSSADAEEVEPILALLSVEDSDQASAMNDMNALMLMCGQRAVSEQTNNIFLKYVSKIEVLTIPPQKWDAPRANIPSGNAAVGSQIELSNKRNDADKIYYTTDGSTPTVNSRVYNWSAKRWWGQRPDGIKNINKPIELKEGMVIKAVTIGPGKEDSEVVTFIYHIGDPASNNDQSALGGNAALTLDQSVIKLHVGASYELSAMAGYSGQPGQDLIWTSSDTAVATVDSFGLVTLVAPGVAVVKAVTADGQYEAACRVIGFRTAAEVINSDRIDLTPEKDNIAPGENDTPEPFARNAEKPEPENTEGDPATASLADEIAGTGDYYQYLKSLARSDRARQEAPLLAGNSLSVFEIFQEEAPTALQSDTSYSDYNTAIFFALLFFSGAGIRYRQYTKEVAS